MSCRNGAAAYVGASRLSKRNTQIKASVMLEHQLQATRNLIELIIAKLRICLTEIRPGVNIIHHHLEIVAVNVVVEAAQDRRDAVVTLLSGV